jgi:hypothetical protein
MTVKKGKLPRGIRNNNPGNIKLSKSTKWLGAVPDAEQSDPTFVQFTEMKWGIRALARVLRTYHSKYKISTVRGIVARWAPPGVEGNPNIAYANFVAASLGVHPSKPLDLSDTSTLYKLVRAISEFENGGHFFSDGLIALGVELSLRSRAELVMSPPDKLTPPTSPQGYAQWRATFPIDDEEALIQAFLFTQHMAARYNLLAKRLDQVRDGIRELRKLINEEI